MSETYTIHVQDETFHLTKDQVQFDSPNYFTSCFFGDFAESQTRTLRLSRDPAIFRIILDYLNGYHVLPLSNSMLPARMSRELALRNLRVDAEFYLLDGLLAQIAGTTEISLCDTSGPWNYVVVTGSKVRRWNNYESVLLTSRSPSGVLRCM